MRAVYIRKYGANEVVEIGDVPKPELRPADLLVGVRAASVNPVDFKTRDGMLKLIRSYHFPLILGSDLSGVVIETGAAVTRFKPGDEIFARLDKDRIGSFAEFAAVGQDCAALKPPDLSYLEAASVPLAGLTAWQALLDVAQLRAGQKVLIHAGSGGVGTFAIQIAKHFGATIATTVSERNIELVKRLGAEIVIDYRRERFEDALRDYDIVFDTVAGETQLRSFGTLRRGGVLVTIAGIPSAKYIRESGLNPLLAWAMAWMNRKATRLAKKHAVRFEYLFMRPDGLQLAEIAKLLEGGVIKPVIDKVYPLDQVKDALAYSESGHATGKVVIQV
jgi:alcohol dehydrogenase